MSFIAAAVGAVGSALIGGAASNNAANTAANAQNQATAAQQAMFGQIQQNLQPYIGAGSSALGQLTSGLNTSATGGPGGQPGFLHNFTAQDLNSNLAPNYQFQLGQGVGATQNAAAAAGGAGGGNALSAINSFAQNYAGNAYQNAFNNYQTNQTAAYSRLSGIAGLGQASAVGSASGAPQFAQGISNTLVGAGANQAAGTVGVANAIGGGLNNLGGYLSLGQMINGNSSNFDGTGISINNGVAGAASILPTGGI